MRWRLTIVLLFLVFGPVPSEALVVRLEADRLTLEAEDDRLRDVLEGFVHAGVQVRIDPRIHARVTGRFRNADVQEALKELLDPYGYALLWDVVDGPLGPLPRLAEIQIFRPGEKKILEPLFDPNANLELATGANPLGPFFVKDEILVAVNKRMRADEFRRLLSEIGGTLIDSVPELGIYRIRLVPGINIPALAEQLSQNPKFHAAEPNYVVSAPPPTILDAGDGTGLRELKPSREGAPPVAILDSGLIAIEGLESAIVGRYDAFNPERTLTDPVGHGTQMALIAAGAVQPGGTTPSEQSAVPIVAIRTFDDNGNASSFSIARSIGYALDQGARVMNMSWGSETKSQFLGDAIAYAQSKDLLVVAAAGNEPTGQRLYPAAYSGVISVSATTADGKAWEKSNYGDFVFLAAPGSAEFPIGYEGPPGSYAGTSIASAYTAHALARYLTAHPEATRKEALAALQEALTDAGPEGKDPTYGYGVLDEAALGRFLGD